MNNKKWMAILLGGIMAASLAAPCSVSAAEKTTLTFWHAMVVSATTPLLHSRSLDDFNASQDEIGLKLSIREPMMVPHHKTESCYAE